MSTIPSTENQPSERGLETEDQFEIVELDELDLEQAAGGGPPVNGNCGCED